MFQLIKSKEKVRRELQICTVYSRFIWIVTCPCVHVPVFRSANIGVYFNCSQRGQSSGGCRWERKRKCCNQRLWSREKAKLSLFFIWALQVFWGKKGICGLLKRWVVVKTHFILSNQLYIRWTGLNTCHPSNQQSDGLCFCLCRLAEQRRRSLLAAADPPDANCSQWIYHTAPPTTVFVTSPYQRHDGKLSALTCIFIVSHLFSHWGPAKKKKNKIKLLTLIFIVSQARCVSPTENESSGSHFAKLDSKMHSMSRLWKELSVQGDTLCRVTESVWLTEWLRSHAGKWEIHTRLGLLTRTQGVNS